MGEIIIAVIAALGGTAGIVSIINAIKKKDRTDEEIIELYRNCLDERLEPIKEDLKQIHESLDKQQELNLCLLRHQITTLYYKGLETKTLPTYDKESVLMMADAYYSLGGNSYIHSIVEEIKTWETTKD